MHQYPRKLVEYVNFYNLPKNGMFKLTYNNIKLMLYFSFRDCFSYSGSSIGLEFESHLPWARNYYTRASLDLAKHNHFRNVNYFSTSFFVNGFGFFRWHSFLFNDSQTFVINNKSKWLVLFVLVIIITDFILPGIFLYFL